jgi:hypothetical protein
MCDAMTVVAERLSRQRAATRAHTHHESITHCALRHVCHVTVATASCMPCDCCHSADLRMLVDERQDGHQQQQQTKGPMTSAISRDSPSTVSGGLLLAALDEVFSGGAVTYSSHYLVPILLFPALAPLLQRMAYWLPDARLRRVAAVRDACGSNRGPGGWKGCVWPCLLGCTSCVCVCAICALCALFPF